MEERVTHVVYKRKLPNRAGGQLLPRAFTGGPRLVTFQFHGKNNGLVTRLVEERERAGGQEQEMTAEKKGRPRERPAWSQWIGYRRKPLE